MTISPHSIRRCRKAIAVVGTMAAISVPVAQAEPPPQNYGPLDPWAFSVLHRGPQATPQNYGPLDPWAYSVLHRHRTRGKLGSCTMAEPQTQATVEVVIPNASDFCELVSKVLATDVFRAPVSVTQGRLWHYDDATLSCLLQYRNTRDRAAIHNSVAACSWFRRLSPGWHINWHDGGQTSPLLPPKGTNRGPEPFSPANWPLPGADEPPVWVPTRASSSRGYGARL